MPCEAYAQSIKSPCWSSGMPVEGPARWTSKITPALRQARRPTNSFISEMPGPAVDVKARRPPARANHHPDRGDLILGLQDRELVLFRLGVAPELAANVVKASISEVAGVIGYQAPTVAPA